MKSPWQFISDLAGRRRHRLAEEKSGPDTSDAPDLNSLPVLPAPTDQAEDVATTPDTDSLPHQGGEPSSQPIRREVQPTAPEMLSAPSGDEQEANDPLPASFETASDTYDASLAKTVRRPSRKIGRAPPAKPDLVHVPPEEPPPMSGKGSFYAELTAVDDDIKRLRSELSKNLRLQNEQLRKMLQRFERS